MPGLTVSKDRFKQPSARRDASGNLRTIGFEIEFTGLSLAGAIQAVEGAYTSTRKKITAAACDLDISELGVFSVELDWEFLKQQAASADKTSADDWVSLLSQAAELVVPIEVVCPPVAVDRLDALLPLTDALREAGAQGTANSLTAAYGVHINARCPVLDKFTVWNYLRAFGLLQWWLVKAHAVDLTRRASSYIDLHPEAYLMELFSTQAPPEIAQIIADYLTHNPTRNRALDMLPLFSELDAAAVQSAVPDDRIKSRPTFHYRLPNCQIDRKHWSLADAWNIWWTVDELAQRPEDLDRLSAHYLAQHRAILGVKRNSWVEFTDQWLRDHELV